MGGVENKRRCSRYVLGGEIGDDAVDEILPHDDGADGLPVRRILPEEQADGLQSDLDQRRRIAHRSHFHQVLLLYRFDRCTLHGPVGSIRWPPVQCVASRPSPARSESERVQKREKQKRHLAASVTHAAADITSRVYRSYRRTARGNCQQFLDTQHFYIIQ